MADLDLIEELDGYGVPLDPMEALMCESCQ